MGLRKGGIGGRERQTIKSKQSKSKGVGWLTKGENAFLLHAVLATTWFLFAYLVIWWMKLYILLFPSTCPKARFITSLFLECVSFMRDWLCFIHVYILSALRSAYQAYCIPYRGCSASVCVQWTRLQVNHLFLRFSKTSLQTLVFLNGACWHFDQNNFFCVWYGPFWCSKDVEHTWLGRHP